MARVNRSTTTRTCRSASPAHERRPQGVRKARPPRRSARLQRLHTAQTAQDSLIAQENEGLGTQLQPPTITQPTGQKRKRCRGIDSLERPVKKRQRPSPTTEEGLYKDTASENADCDDPIDYWRRHQRWPRAYFEPGEKMSQLLARKKSDSTLRRTSSKKSLTSGDTTPSDDNRKGPKRATYLHPGYEILLMAKDIYLDDLDQGVTAASKVLCRRLLKTKQTTPHHSLFNDEVFDRTCRGIRNRKEAKVVQDISRLIVPSAEALALHGNGNLDNLVETVSESWTESMTLLDSQPSPDYSVGFVWSSFTPPQRKRLSPWLGELTDLSPFKATYFMYFPFLTCEVKCGAEALNIADRQNAHSATLAVRAVVELFRLAKREKELNREILAFSVSHDHSNVRIYAHYPLIDGKETKYYRHKIRIFDFTEQDGKEKWTAYKFVKNVYENWMPNHLKRICSAIDELPPDGRPDISQESEFSGRTSLLRELDSHHLSQSESSVSVAGRSNRSSVVGVGNTTPDTSVSRSFKKPKRKRL